MPHPAPYPQPVCAATIARVGPYQPAAVGKGPPRAASPAPSPHHGQHIVHKLVASAPHCTHGRHATSTAALGHSRPLGSFAQQQRCLSLRSLSSQRTRAFADPTAMQPAVCLAALGHRRGRNRPLKRPRPSWRHNPRASAGEELAAAHWGPPQSAWCASSPCTASAARPPPSPARAKQPGHGNHVARVYFPGALTPACRWAALPAQQAPGCRQISQQTEAGRGLRPRGHPL